MNLADVFIGARLAKGWSARELSRRAKVDPAIITRIEKGQQDGGRADTIARLGTTLGIPPDVVQRLLAGENVESFSPPERTPEDILQEALSAIRRQREREEAERKERERAEKIAQREQELRAQGLVGDVYRISRAQQSVSAGYGYTLDAEIGMMSGPAPRVEDRISVKITGDCMEPIIPQGAVVIVDKALAPKNGDVVLVDHEGEWLCKAYTVEPDGTIWLKALQHRDPIKPNGHTTIIGVVVDVQNGRPKVNL